MTPEPASAGDRASAPSPESETVRDCPVCNRATEHVFRYRKWGFPILQCRTCGVGVTQMDESFDADRLYGRGYFHGEARDGYADYTGSEPVLRSEFRQTVAALRQHGPATGRLLEVGCAYGFFLQEAGEHYQCTGIDVCDDAVAFARRRGLDVHCGRLDTEFVRRHGPFDAAVLLDVVEHLDRPAEVLGVLGEALRPGGALLVTTGDWGSLTARVMGRRWRLMTPPQHLYFYSRATLTALLERFGFEVVVCEHPWKRVSLGLAAYQFTRRCRLPIPVPKVLNRLSVPVNLFDAVRVVARRR